MTTYRQIYENMPATVQIPQAYQHRRVEIILRPLDEQPSEWQPDFFARTEGQWAGEPLVREEVGEYETRDDIE